MEMSEKKHTFEKINIEKAKIGGLDGIFVLCLVKIRINRPSKTGFYLTSKKKNASI